MLTALRGELEPCGCSLEPLGGARLTTYLRSRDEKGVTPLLIAWRSREPRKVSKGSLPQIKERVDFTKPTHQPRARHLGNRRSRRRTGGIRSVEGMPWLDPKDLKIIQGVQFLRRDNPSDRLNETRYFAV